MRVSSFLQGADALPVVNTASTLIGTSQPHLGIRISSRNAMQSPETVSTHRRSFRCCVQPLWRVFTCSNSRKWVGIQSDNRERTRLSVGPAQLPTMGMWLSPDLMQCFKGAPQMSRAVFLYSPPLQASSAVNALFLKWAHHGFAGPAQLSNLGIWLSVALM